MALTPARTKYPFNHCPSYEGPAKGNNELHEGDFGLQASAGCYLSNRAFEAVRLIVKPLSREYGWKIRWNVFPHWGRTKKPIGVRMGSGKGSVESWEAVVKEGTIILEVMVPKESQISPKEEKELEKKMKEARRILAKATYKLPGGKWKVVEKTNKINIK